MQLHILKFFEGLAVVLVAIVCDAGLVLKPHRLVVVNAHIVAAVLHKDVHDAGAFLNVACLESVHCADGIDGPVRLVKIPRFFKELSSLLTVTSFLVDLTFKRV